jgi:hypothetical protein
MIVKGSTGDKKTLAKLNKCANEISKWSFIARRMVPGIIPVKKDSELTADDIRKYNLILLGMPEQNKFLNKIKNKLIANIDKSEINISDKKFSLKGNGLWLCQFNPENKKKMIWIWASDNINFYNSKAEWLNYWDFPAEDPPDLLLVNVSGQSYANARHFTKDWLLDENKMQKIRSSVSNKNQIVGLAAKTMLKVSSADFAWLQKRKLPKFSNVKNFSAAETANIVFKNSMLCVCKVSGKDIKKLIAKNPGAIFKSEKNMAIAPNKIYKIVMIPEALSEIAKITKSYLTNVEYVNVPLRQLLQQKLVK